MIWSKKYRPTSVDDYITGDNKPLISLLEAEAPRHLLLYGEPGTGKTTFAEVYAGHFGTDIHGVDYNMIRPWDLRGVEDVRNRLSLFTNACTWGDNYKFLILEECDDLTTIAQNSLKVLIEEAAENIIYILITNNIVGVNTALQSRCLCLRIDGTHDKLFQYAKRVLNAEGIAFDPDKLSKILNGYPHDLRAGIDRLQVSFG